MLFTFGLMVAFPEKGRKVQFSGVSRIAIVRIRNCQCYSKIIDIHTSVGVFGAELD